MSDVRPRGLGRGLSALLGEPVKTEAPKPANNVFGQPQPVLLLRFAASGFPHGYYVWAGDADSFG